MSDEFFCPKCCRHKPIGLRSEKRASTSWVCIACNEAVKKRLKLHPKTPAGLTLDHIINGKAKRKAARNARNKEFRAMKADHEWRRKLNLDS